MTPVRALLTGLLLGALCQGCVGTTGGETFEFAALAAGPADATPGEPYVFDSGRGYTVSLDEAELHVGAVYLNRAVAISVSSDTSCQLAGVYSAEVTSGLELDVLSGVPLAFPVPGRATSGDVQTGEVWLTSGDVNAGVDPTPILRVSGTATRDGQTYPFDGTLTISSNRSVTPSNPATPGAKPICKQRIVSPIRVGADLEPGGTLTLHVDPRGFFANVDFDALPPPGVSGRYRFADDSSDPASDNLHGGLLRTAAYSFEWAP